MFIIDGTHKCSRGRQHLIDKDKDCLFGGKLDPFADYVAELADCQVRRDEVFFLVDNRYIRFRDLFADNLSPSR